MRRRYDKFTLGFGAVVDDPPPFAFSLLSEACAPGLIASQSQRVQHANPVAMVSEHWVEGLTLGEAWFMLASPETKEQYRGANDAASIILQRMMQEDLTRQVRDGALVCIGVRTAPDLSDGPEILPAFLFAEPEIDWSESAVRSYGRVYESVRIAEAAEGSSEGDLQEPRQPKRLGRPPVGNEVRAVVRALVDEGVLAGKFRKEQVPLVRERARRDYPGLFPKVTQPSRNKILEALKAVGL